MSGRNGTVAILFYSLFSNGQVDEYSWHCGCPVIKGTKWSANSWIWNQPQNGRGIPPRHPQRDRKATLQKKVTALEANLERAKKEQAEKMTGSPAIAPKQLEVVFENLSPKEVEVMWVD